MRKPKWFVLGAVGVILVKIRKVECPGGGSDANITVGVGEAGEKRGAEIKQASQQYWEQVEEKQELAQAEQKELENWFNALKTTDQAEYQKAHDEKMALGWQGVKEFKETGKTHDERKQEIERWMNTLKTKDQAEYDKVKNEFDNHGVEAVELYRKTNKTWEERQEEQKQLQKWVDNLQDKNKELYDKVMALYSAKGWDAVKHVKTVAVWLVELKSTYPDGADAMDYVVAMVEFETNGWESLKQWKEHVDLNKWIAEADKVPESSEKKKDTKSGSADASAEAGQNANELLKQELKTWMDGLKTTDQELYKKMEYVLNSKGWKGVEKAKDLREWMETLKQGNKTDYDRVTRVLDSMGWEGVERARKLILWMEEMRKVKAARNMDPAKKMDQMSLLGLVVFPDDQDEMTKRQAADKKAREAERQAAKQAADETLTRNERVRLLEWVALLKVNDNNKFNQARQEYKLHGWEGLKLFRESGKPRKQREEEAHNALAAWMEELKTKNQNVHDKVNEVFELSGFEGVKRVKSLAAWLVDLNSANNQEYNKAKQELDSKGWQAVREYKAKIEKEEADKAEKDGKQWIENLKSNNQEAYNKVKELFDQSGWAAVYEYKQLLDWLNGLNTNNNNAYKNAMAEFQKGGLDGLKQFKDTGKPKEQRDKEAADKAKEDQKRIDSVRAELVSWMDGQKESDYSTYLNAQNVYNTGGFDALNAFKETGKTDQDRRAAFEESLDQLLGTNELLHALVMGVYNTKGWEAAAAYKDELSQAETQVKRDAETQVKRDAETQVKRDAETLVTPGAEKPVTPGSGQLRHGGELELALDCDGKITEIEREVTEKVKKKEKKSVQKILVAKQLWVLVRWNRKDWDETQYDRWDDWEQKALREELDEAEMGLKRQQQKLAEAEQQAEQAIERLDNLDAEIKALEQAGVTVDESELSAKKPKPGERVEEIELDDGTKVRVTMAASSSASSTDSTSTSDQAEQEQHEAEQQLTPDQQNLLTKKRERIKLDEQVGEALEKWASRRGLVTQATQRVHKARTAVTDWDTNMTTQQKKDRASERIKKRITQVDQDLNQLTDNLAKLKQQSGQEVKVSQLEAQLQELEKAKKVLASLAAAEQTDDKIQKSEQEVKTAREALEQRKKKSIEQKEAKAAELKKEIEKENNGLNDLKTKLASAKNKDKPAIEEQIKQAEQAVKSLDDEVKLISARKLEEERDNAARELEQLKRKLEHLKTKPDGTQDGSADAEAKQTLEQQVQQAEQNLEKAVSAVKKHDEDRLNNLIKAKKKELEDAKKEHEELKAKLDKATKDKDKKALEPQVQLAEQKVKTLDDEVKFLEAEKKIKEELENANKELNELKTKSAAATNDTDRQQLETQLKQAEQKVNKALEDLQKLESDRISKKIEQNKQQLEKATKERDELKNKLSKATKDKDKKSLGEQIKKAEQAVNILDSQVKELEAEKKLKEDLENAIKQNDTAKIQEAEKALQKHEVDQMNKKIEAKKKELEEANKEHEELKDKLANAKNKDKPAIEEQIKQAEQKVNLLDSEAKILDAASKIAEAGNKLRDAEAKLRKELADAVAQNDAAKAQKAEQDLAKLEGEWNQLEQQKKQLREQRKQHLEKSKEALGDLKYKLESAKNELNELEVQVQQAERAAYEKNQALEDNQFVEVWMKKTDYELMEIGRKRADKPVPMVLEEQELTLPEQDEDGRYTERAFEEEVETEAVETRKVPVKMVKLMLRGLSAGQEPGVGQPGTGSGDQNGPTVGHVTSVAQPGTGSGDPEQPDHGLGGPGQTVWLRKDSLEVQRLLQRAKAQGLSVERDPDEGLGDGPVTPAEQQALQVWMEKLKNEDKKLYDKVHLVLMSDQWAGVRRYKKKVDKSRAAADRVENELKAEAEAEKRALEARGRAWVEKRDDLMQDWAARLRALGLRVPGGNTGGTGGYGGTAGHGGYGTGTGGNGDQFRGLGGLGGYGGPGSGIGGYGGPGSGIGGYGGHGGYGTGTGGTGDRFRGTRGQKPDIDWGGSGAGGLDVLFGGRDTASVLRQATFMTSWGGNDEFNLVKYMRTKERLASGGVVIHGEQGWERLYGWGGMGLGDVAAAKGAKVETLKAGTVLKIRDHLGRIREIEVKQDMTVYDGGSRSVWDTTGALKLGSVHDVDAQKEGEQQPTKQTEQERRQQLEQEWRTSQQQKQAAKGESESSGPRLVLTVTKARTTELVYSTSGVGSASTAGIRA